MLIQHGIGSAQKVIIPKYFIRAHQTKDRNESPNKNNNTARFDNLDLRQLFVEIDSLRYPRDSSTLNCEKNDYIEQYKDLKISFKKYIGQPLSNTLISYPDIKRKYSIGIRD